MFKPLLRTLPSLTGNIKLACEINDYVDAHLNVFIRQTDAEICFPNYIDVKDVFGEV